MPLILGVDADTKKATSKIKKASKQAGADVKKLEKNSISSANKIGGAFKGLAASLGLVFGVGAVVAGIRKAISAASDLNESLNLVVTTFESSADSAIAFAEKAASAIGETKGAALGLLGEIGALVKSFGFSADAASNFSQTVLQLAADIGSFKNAQTSDVLNAIRSALIGSSEPMLRFGSDTRVAALEQFALAEGIIEVNEKLNNETRAVAALGKIIKDNQDAIGDFSKTQGDFATASKIAAAQVNEVFETIGTGMLPAATKFVVGTGIIIENLDLLKATMADFLISQTGPVRFGLLDVEEAKAAAGKVKDVFIDVLEFFKKVSGFNQAAAPGNLFDQILGVDDEGKEQTKNKARLAVNEIIDLINSEFKKIDASFNIAEGFEKAKESLTEVGELLDGQVAPAAMRIESSFGFIASRSGEIAVNQGIVAVNAINTADAIEDLSRSQQIATQAAGTFSQNLARALISGKGLEKTLLSTAINFGLSFIPGGSLFGGLFAHGGIAPGGGIPSIVGEGGGAEIIQSASPIKVTPLTTNNNNSVTNLNLSFPNVREIDDFTLRTQIVPKINEMVRDGTIRLTASDLA